MKRSDIPRTSGAASGCYDLQLYCQHPDAEPYGPCSSYPGEFQGHDYKDASSEARKHGWWISKRDLKGHHAVLCPVHAREVPR